MQKQTLALVTDGFEEIELVTPVDLLRRAGGNVIIAGVGDGLTKTGRCGMKLVVDCLLADVAPNPVDLLLLPGGPGVSALRQDGRAAHLAAVQIASGRLVAAICAAPTILADAGLLATGTKYTAHFSVANELPNILSDEEVVRDGLLITSRGAGTALAFGLALVAALHGENIATEIGTAIMVSRPALLTQ